MPTRSLLPASQLRHYSSLCLFQEGETALTITRKLRLSALGREIVPYSKRANGLETGSVAGLVSVQTKGTRTKRGVRAHNLHRLKELRAS